MNAGRNKIYLVLALVLWIIAYISSFAIQGGTPLGPFLYILGSVFFLLTQKPQQAVTSQAQTPAEDNGEHPAEDEELDD